MEPLVANSKNLAIKEDGEINIPTPTSVQGVEEMNEVPDTQTENTERVEAVEVLYHEENQVDLKLTMEGMNEAANSKPSRVLSAVHLGPSIDG